MPEFYMAIVPQITGKELVLPTAPISYTPMAYNIPQTPQSA